MTKPRTLRLWAQGNAHVGRDLQFGHTSLSGALSQSEFGSPFNSGLFESFLKNNPGAVDIWLPVTLARIQTTARADAAASNEVTATPYS